MIKILKYQSHLNKKINNNFITFNFNQIQLFQHKFLDPSFCKVCKSCSYYQKTTKPDKQIPIGRFSPNGRACNFNLSVRHPDIAFAVLLLKIQTTFQAFTFDVIILTCNNSFSFGVVLTIFSLFAAGIKASLFTWTYLNVISYLVTLGPRM